MNRGNFHLYTTRYVAYERRLFEGFQNDTSFNEGE